MSDDATALTQQIAALEEALKLPLPLATRAQIEQDLAKLRAALRQPERAHTQDISGNAQVGVAIAGNVQGPVTHQSGGVNLGSGNTIDKIGDIVAGDKIAGDKVQGDKHVHFGAPRPADTGPDHIQRLLDLHTRRLRVLEEQATRTGYNTQPEVLTEIDDIRAEIARLHALLER